MYAASFEIAAQWKEAQYNALFGAHGITYPSQPLFPPSISFPCLIENSVHVLVRTIDDLCSTFTALASAENSYAIIHQKRIEFVRLSSEVLLRMADKVSKDKTTIKDYASLVVFIDLVPFSSLLFLWVTFGPVTLRLG